MGSPEVNKPSVQGQGLTPEEINAMMLSSVASTNVIVPTDVLTPPNVDLASALDSDSMDPTDPNSIMYDPTIATGVGAQPPFNPNAVQQKDDRKFLRKFKGINNV
jgi:hypothetical protein